MNRTRSAERRRRPPGSARPRAREAVAGTPADSCSGCVRGRRPPARARRGRAPAPARARRPARAAAIASRPSRKAPKPTTSRRARRHALQHQRPGREQQVGALADDQLADERHQRLPVPHSRQRRARPPGSLAKALRLGALGLATPARAPARPARARHVGHRPAVLAGAEAGHVHAREGRAACGPAAAGRRSPAHRLSAVWREPTSTALRRRQALAREAEEALRFGLDGVLERAAVDLHRVGRSRRARARGRGSRAPSRGGWRAPAPAPRGRPPRRRPRRSPRM